jgi:hypothetical protein
LAGLKKGGSDNGFRRSELLPPFDDLGNLPPGFHECNTDELVSRFGIGSSEREIETQELLDFIEWARSAGIQRLIVNGSYVTSKSAPNDVDIVVLPGPDYPRGELPCDEQQSRWPFLQILVAADEADLEEWAIRDFGTDRNRNPKGVIEVPL